MVHIRVIESVEQGHGELSTIILAIWIKCKTLIER